MVRSIPSRVNSICMLVCSKSNGKGSLAKGKVVGDARALGRNKLFRALQAILVFCLFDFTLREIGSHWKISSREMAVTDKDFRRLNLITVLRIYCREAKVNDENLFCVSFAIF